MFDLWQENNTVLFFKEAVDAYGLTLQDSRAKEAFYNRSTLVELETAMNTNMGGGLPMIGFFEMKQDVYDIARRMGAY